MATTPRKQPDPTTSGFQQIATHCIECGLDLLVLNANAGPQVTAFMGLPCKTGKLHVPWAQGTPIRVY